MRKVLFATFAVVVGIDVITMGPFATLVGLAVASAGAMLFIAPHEAWLMRRNPNYHCWPSVTTCQLCSRRIFSWQRKERRSARVHIDNPDCIDVGISGSCIVHRGCVGTPTMEMSIRRPSRAA